MCICVARCRCMCDVCLSTVPHHTCRRSCLLQQTRLQASLRGNWQSKCVCVCGCVCVCVCVCVCEYINYVHVCIATLLSEGLVGVGRICLFVCCLFVYRQEAEVKALSDDVEQRNM